MDHSYRFGDLIVYHEPNTGTQPQRYQVRWVLGNDEIRHANMNWLNQG
jgi:hypothetical protein